MKIGVIMKNNFFIKGIIVVAFTYFSVSCKQKTKIKEDIIFHAGPSESDLVSTFFSLYKDGTYEFCDGDFLSTGCYIGDYKINGDTLTLENLKLNDHVKNNRFIIYRFREQDSTYWKNKFAVVDWRESKRKDSLEGITGEIFELDKDNKPRKDVSKWYVIRFDKMK